MGERPAPQNVPARVTFNEATRRLLDGTNFATVATVNPDGGPQSSVVWVKREGDTVLFSTTTQRQKGRNLARDPRVSVSIFATGDPYDYVEIRGRAELVPDPGKELPGSSPTSTAVRIHHPSPATWSV